MKKHLKIFSFYNVYHKWQLYGIWFFRYGVQQTKVFVILDHFLPFYPYNNPKNSKFWKILKTPGDIIILHKCHKNHDHMLYCSSDMARNAHNYFSFWAIFCPFTAQKIKLKKKKMKKSPEDTITLHKRAKNYDLMMYGSWDMVHYRCNYYFSF